MEGVPANLKGSKTKRGRHRWHRREGTHGKYGISRSPTKKIPKTGKKPLKIFRRGTKEKPIKIRGEVFSIAKKKKRYWVSQSKREN